ncbi:MAG: hypothetical protein ACFE0K_00470 [Alcanivorax sp.]|uniref:hypothetical protein n=1 Tax=Alcanivorax sp. TaxID=1872427 RepID=UPI003DA79394
MFYQAIFMGIVIGSIGELLASRLSLWKYKSPWLAIGNIVVMFGIFCGGIALIFDSHIARFTAGFTFGLIYEVLNSSVLHAWSFSSGRLRSINISTLVIVLAVAWGTVPLLISHIIEITV